MKEKKKKEERETQFEVSLPLPSVSLEYLQSYRLNNLDLEFCPNLWNRDWEKFMEMIIIQVEKKAENITGSLQSYQWS